MHVHVLSQSRFGVSLVTQMTEGLWAFAPELHNQLFNTLYEFLRSIQSVYAWSFNSVTGAAIHSVPGNLSCAIVEVSRQEW